MKIKEYLEFKSEELEEKRLNYGKKVLHDLELFEVIEISQEEYLQNRESDEYVTSENLYFRLTYQDFTHDQIDKLTSISKELKSYDDKMIEKTISTNLSSIFKGIGIVTIVISFVLAIVVGEDIPVFGMIVFLSGALVSINYFAIAEILKLLKKITLNTESEDKIN